MILGRVARWRRDQGDHLVKEPPSEGAIALSCYCRFCPQKEKICVFFCFLISCQTKADLQIVPADLIGFVVVCNFAEESFFKFLTVFEIFFADWLQVKNSCVFLSRRDLLTFSSRARQASQTKECKIWHFHAPLMMKMMMTSWMQ